MSRILQLRWLTVCLSTGVILGIGSPSWGATLPVPLGTTVIPHPAAGASTASTPSCDFKARTCKITENELLTFDLILPTTLPMCLFADPRTLPDGASFPAQTGIGKVQSTFTWTPHECQAGEYIVHFHASFICYDLFFASPFPLVLTMTVNDAEPCAVIGACCLPDGMCQDLTEEECHEREGLFDRESLCQVTSGENPFCNFPRFGACCKPDGTCADLLEDICELREQGQFLGEGTSCGQTDPPVVCTGACCKNDFTCEDGLTGAACEGEPIEGEFRGAGTVCNEIPPCSGACCFPDGACFHLPHERDCKNRLGMFKGRDTECASQGGTVTCPVTGGSCCPGPMSTFTGCRTVDPIRCGQMGGALASPDACPTPTKCPPASGACCRAGEVSSGGPFCTNNTDPINCTSPDFYLGDGTRCGDDDNDGADNCCDFCPNTPPGEPVIECFPFVKALFGCSCTQRPEICDDRDVCTRDVCAPRDLRADELGCVHLPITSCCETDEDCNDNDACTLDVCVSRTCSNSRFTCENDGIQCTVDRCDRVLGCNYPDHARCDDRDRCTVDVCVPEQGCTNRQKVCDDRITCTHDSCNRLSGDCQFAPDNGLCYDNDACTVDTCEPENPNRDGDGCVFTPRQVAGSLDCGDGDVNGDGVTDLNDLAGLTACLDASGPFTTVNSECPPADFDGDGDIDLADWLFAMNDPFRCDPFNCESGVGGKCITTCEPAEVCVPDGGESVLLSEMVGVAVGGARPTDGGVFVATGQSDDDCKRPCSSVIDCFSTSKCEDCLDGFCKSRCDPMQCQNPCDGAGNCPSKCTVDEVCVEGECRERCLIDADCPQNDCLVCRDGACVPACTDGQLCVVASPFGPAACGSGCTGPDDCPACHACIRSFDGETAGCLPCKLLGADCRNDRCREPCEDETSCAACERCEDGICVNNCPKGQICDTHDGICRGGCASDADCAGCETCFYDARADASYCLNCVENFPCVLCNDEGKCVPRCDSNMCEKCVPVVAGGGCISRCDTETETCDGAGTCVPR